LAKQPQSAATNVVAIAAGNLHSVALRADGTVVGWGYSQDGSTTIRPPPQRVAIAAGSGFSAALRRTERGAMGNGLRNIPAGKLRMSCHFRLRSHCTRCATTAQSCRGATNTPATPPICSPAWPASSPSPAAATTTSGCSARARRHSPSSHGTGQCQHHDQCVVCREVRRVQPVSYQCSSRRNPRRDNDT